ncbi:hypothetical protein COV93_05150 [Candidatus Woesearchaeota archaeon CG11_big_fil_rev_8_21_14_0_20_43_8]|nr:MAG: hypothetical protein COV93_05150 [Candidatus Woesearchaeota archaeon CG11_big_fil_rev_8_21_14_0_20_43_8]PIO09039.1 MAG: hypothetical protein COT47_00080 [Candidatus Woesearchaeota archaeon CG08_land_8_20_14_0_20_43_7]
MTTIYITSIRFDKDYMRYEADSYNARSKDPSLLSPIDSIMKKNIQDYIWNDDEFIPGLERFVNKHMISMRRAGFSNYGKAEDVRYETRYLYEMAEKMSDWNGIESAELIPTMKHGHGLSEFVSIAPRTRTTYCMPKIEVIELLADMINWHLMHSDGSASVKNVGR